MPVTLAVIGGGAKLYGAYNANQQQKKSQRALDQLRTNPMARYSVDPRIAGMYQQAASEASAPRGFGGSAEAGFRNMLAKNMRGRFMNATTVGGGSSARGVNAVLAGQEGDALTNYATANENMMRGNRNAALGRMGTYAGQYQRTADQNTGNDINYRMQLERALGEGVRSNRDYQQNFLGSMGSDLITAGIYGMGKRSPSTIITPPGSPSGDYQKPLVTEAMPGGYTPKMDNVGTSFDPLNQRVIGGPNGQDANLSRYFRQGLDLDPMMRNTNDWRAIDPRFANRFQNPRV